MLTSPRDNESSNLVLGQGLPSSPMLAFLCNKSLFDYIDNYSTKNNIIFSVYVDDITFSSDNEIPQSFIDTIMGLLKRNNLKTNKKKIHRPKKERTKIITGVHILKTGETSVAKRKHEELFCLYESIVSKLNDDKLSFDKYFQMFNEFIKFSGNLIHLCAVQYHGDLNVSGGNFVHKKYSELYHKLLPCFKIGIKKKDKMIEYSVDNVKTKEDLEVLNDSYSRLLAKQKDLSNCFKPINKKSSLLKRYKRVPTTTDFE